MTDELVYLAITTQRQGVATQPRGVATTSNRLVEAVSLANTAVLCAGGSESTHLAVLVHGADDPVDAGVATDGLVRGVDQDDLKELVGGVLVDPVRVEHSQIGASLADTLLGDRAQRALELEGSDTLVDGLAERGALLGHPLPVAATHAHAVDDVALLGLVAEAAGLVGARGARRAVDDVQLSELPAAHAQQEAQDVALLLLVELLEVFVRAHSWEKKLLPDHAAPRKYSWPFWPSFGRRCCRHCGREHTRPLEKTRGAAATADRANAQMRIRADCRRKLEAAA